MTRNELPWLSRNPHYMALVALVWLTACVVAQSPEPTTPPPAEYRSEHGHPPQAGHPSAPYHNHGPAGRRPLPPHSQPGQPHHQPPAADCSQRPSFACCKALTPECNACTDNARASQEQWDRECASAGPVHPQPQPAPPSQPVVDCSQTPGTTMCCQANNAQCNACKRNAAAEKAAWDRECVSAGPVRPRPQPGTPAQPVVDCGKTPGTTMCCQANNAQCNACKRNAAAEKAAWDRECVSAGPVRPRPGTPGTQPGTPSDCSKRPAFACCKALTPQCNACVENARASQAQWDRECASAGPVQPQPQPGKPVVDCNQAPGRMCCQAQTAACNSCKREAAAEQAAWARQCE
jgi:hypothetical protein